MPSKSQREKLEHHQIFRSFFGWRQPCTLHTVLSSKIVQVRIQGTVGMVLTLSQLFGGLRIRTSVEHKATKLMIDLMEGEDLAMFVPEGIMPQVVSEQPISPIPAHICLGGSEETVAMKLKQRGWLTPS
jgi:hypothetical protein